VSLSEELLDLAEASAALGTQAGFRRAISSAYYALFHLLGEALGERFAPGDLKSLRHHLRRALEHHSMKAASNHVASLRPRTADSKGKKAKPDDEVDLTQPERKFFRAVPNGGGRA
jgi:hypothetical protein